MNFRDTVGMALGNLRGRFWRTALNLFGVFSGCLLLFVILGVIRGTSSAANDFVQQNPQLHRIEFMMGYGLDHEVPDEFTQVTGEMSNERRARISKRLHSKWCDENLMREPFGRHDIQRLEQLPHVVEVIPAIYLQADIDVDGVSFDGQSIGVSTQDLEMKSRVIAGQPLREDDETGLLLHEFTAYQMGWKDDTQLTELIGRSATVRYQLSGRRLSNVLEFLGSSGGAISIDHRTRLLAAFKQLIDEMDATKLSDQQKDLIRETINASIESVKIKDGGPAELIAVQKFVIRGIVCDSDEDNPLNQISRMLTGDFPDIYVPHRLNTGMFFRDVDNDGFYHGRVQVDNYRNLKDTEEAIESLGYHAESASWFISNLERNITRFGLVAGGIGLAIFLVTMLGIANSMTISVIQRTSDFGIMKALGARDSEILKLLLFEGGLVGLVGVSAAWFVSIGFAFTIESVIRARWLGDLEQSNMPNLIQFQWADVLFVFLLAILVCVLSAVLPARSAARLDPTEAMRR